MPNFEMPSQTPLRALRSNLLQKRAQEAKDKLDIILERATESKDLVSALQYLCVQKEFSMPEYRFEIIGPYHIPTMICACTVSKSESDRVTKSAEGRSKKEAKKAAAQQLFYFLIS